MCADTRAKSYKVLFILVVYLPDSLQWINIPLYCSVILHPPFDGRFPLQLSAMLFYSSLISASVSSSFLSPSAQLHYTHTTEDKAGLYTRLWTCSSVAARERERRGCARGCQQWYQVQGRRKRVGCNYTELLVQTGVEGGGGGGGRYGEQARQPVRQKQRLRPGITVQSVSKQIISAVRLNEGRQAQLWKEAILRFK